MRGQALRRFVDPSVTAITTENSRGCAARQTTAVTACDSKLATEIKLHREQIDAMRRRNLLVMACGTSRARPCQAKFDTSQHMARSTIQSVKVLFY